MTPAPPLSLARVSLLDVARAVGVSHVAVSLALRGDRRISTRRRSEIQAAAERLGYRPDPMLSSLAAYRQTKHPVTISATVAWLNQWKDPKSLYRLHEFDAYWHGARTAADRLGYRVEEFVVDGEMTGDRLQRILTTRGVRGILIPPHTEGLELSGFDWSQFSIVRFGISVKQPRAHVVTSDQMNCAVTSRVFDRKTGGNFRAGYLSTQDALAPKPRRLPPLFLEDETTLRAADRLRAWLKTAAPDAVISTQPVLATLLAKIGWKVPRDVGVAALSVLDGNFDCGVDQNSSEIGSVAMRTLAGLIHQNERGIPNYCRRILVEGRWVEGSSLP